MRKNKKKYKIKLQQKRELRIIFWIVTIGVLITGWGEYLFKNIAYASAPYSRMNNTFTFSEDKDTSKMTVKERIILEAQKANFQWTDYLLRLGQCESGLREFATNSNGNKPEYSKDRGVFMINDYWHKEVSDDIAFNVEKATRWTMDKINKGGQRQWVCDRHVRNNPDKYAYN